MKWLSSLTSLPRNTTRPLNFRPGLPSGRSEPFSTQMPKTMPTCIRIPFCLASSFTIDHSLTPFSFQAPTSRSAVHSFSMAACAFALPFSSLGLTDRATTASPSSPSESDIFSLCGQVRSPDNTGIHGSIFAGAPLMNLHVATSALGCATCCASFFCLGVIRFQISGQMPSGRPDARRFCLVIRPSSHLYPFGMRSGSKT